MLLRDILNWVIGTPTIGDERSHQRFYSRRDLWEKRAYLWWLYPVIGLYTFGHCATNYPVMDMRHWSSSSDEAPKEERDSFTTAAKATAAGVAWPMYWTWEVMDDAS